MESGIERFEVVKMSLIEEPGHQLRAQILEEGLDELKASMGKRGLLQPILLRPKGERFEIKAGHRRYLAAHELGWDSIKAIIRERTDEDTILDAIHENLHREDMTPMEDARAAALIRDREKKSIKEIARMFSKSESWVLSRLDLLEYPEELKKAVDVGALSVSAARELSRITDDAARAYYIEFAIKQGATAQLCAFWRGNWEVQRVVNDPSGNASAAQSLTPPPMVVTLPCYFCDQPIPIHLLNHLRACPICTGSIVEEKAKAEQEAFAKSLEVVDGGKGGQ